MQHACPLTCGWRPVWQTSCQWRTQSSRSQPRPKSYWEGKICSSGLWTPSRIVGTGKPGAAQAWLWAEKTDSQEGWQCGNTVPTAYDIFSRVKVKHVPLWLVKFYAWGPENTCIPKIHEMTKVIHVHYRTLEKCYCFGVFFFVSCLNAVICKNSIIILSYPYLSVFRVPKIRIDFSHVIINFHKHCFK